MLVTGLSDLLMRSLDYDYSLPDGNIGYNCAVYLFRDSTAESIEDLDIDFLDSTQGNRYSNIALKADGMAMVQLNTVREGTKVSLQISNHNYATYREKDGCWYKPASISAGLHDLNADATQTLGDCVMFTGRNYINNLGGSVNSAPTQNVPALASEESFYSLARGSDGGPWHLNSLAGKILGGPFYYAVNFGRRSSDSNARRRDYTCIMFDHPVEADFILFHIIRSTTGTLTTQQIGALYVINENNQLVSIGASISGRSLGLNFDYRFNFPKQVIKGIGIISHPTSVTSAQTSFYLRKFTAGLRDYHSNPMFSDLVRPDWTRAVIIPNIPASYSNDSIGVPMGIQSKASVPMLLCDVGPPESDAKLKINGQGQYYIDSNFFVDGQKFLELDQ